MLDAQLRDTSRPLWTKRVAPMERAQWKVEAQELGLGAAFGYFEHFGSNASRIICEPMTSLRIADRDPYEVRQIWLEGSTVSREYRGYWDTH